MVIYRDRHRLLGILLSYDIFVEELLYPVRQRYVFDIDDRCLSFLVFVLFLCSRSSEHHVLKIGHGEESDMRKPVSSGKAHIGALSLLFGIAFGIFLRWIPGIFLPGIFGFFRTAVCFVFGPVFRPFAKERVKHGQIVRIPCKISQLLRHLHRIAKAGAAHPDPVRDRCQLSDFFGAPAAKAAVVCNIAHLSAPVFMKIVGI